MIRPRAAPDPDQGRRAGRWRAASRPARFAGARDVPRRHPGAGEAPGERLRIVQEMWCPEVTYWHVELAGPRGAGRRGRAVGILFRRWQSHALRQSRRHHPGEEFCERRQNGRYAEAACHPLLQDGPLLDQIRARIEARAAAVAAPARTIAAPPEAKVSGREGDHDGVRQATPLSCPAGRGAGPRPGGAFALDRARIGPRRARQPPLPGLSLTARTARRAPHGGATVSDDASVYSSERGS